MGTVRIMVTNSSGLPVGEFTVDSSKAATHRHSFAVFNRDFPFHVSAIVSVTEMESRLSDVESHLTDVGIQLSMLAQLQDQVRALAARMDSLRLVEGVKPSELQEVVDSLESQVEDVHGQMKDVQRLMNELRRNVDSEFTAHVLSIGRLANQLKSHTHTIDTKAETFTTGRAK